MSDDYHRPTLTFPSGAYNATQVRLYGIKAVEKKNSGMIFPGKELSIASQFGDINLSFSYALDEGNVGEDKAAAEKLIADSTKDLISRIGENDYKPGDAEIFSNLVRNFSREAEVAKIGYVAQISIATKQMGDVSISTTITSRHAALKMPNITCGIIVGYSYEGHTYDLPKPKIMIIPTAPEAVIPLDDSGYEKKQSEGYAVWLVDKLDECLEFEMNQGFVEQLILEANLPGKRAPNMYAGKMMTGHRGGKLSE
jgi:hypothetical protein